MRPLRCSIRPGFQGRSKWKRFAQCAWKFRPSRAASVASRMRKRILRGVGVEPTLDLLAPRAAGEAVDDAYRQARGGAYPRRSITPSADGGRRDGKPGPLAPRSRRQIHRMLSQALARAVEQQIIARNPCDVFKRRLPKVERKEMKVLTAAQSAQLLERHPRAATLLAGDRLLSPPACVVARSWRFAGAMLISTVRRCGLSRVWNRRPARSGSSGRRAERGGRSPCPHSP